LLCLFAAVAAAACAPAGAQSSLQRHWEGAINLPNASLGIQVEFKPAEKGWQGTIDIPKQGAPLRSLLYAG